LLGGGTTSQIQYIYRGSAGAGANNNVVVSTTIPVAANMWDVDGASTPPIVSDKLYAMELSLRAVWSEDVSAYKAKITLAISMYDGSNVKLGETHYHGDYQSGNQTANDTFRFTAKIPIGGKFYYKVVPLLTYVGGTGTLVVTITDHIITEWATKTIISNAGLQVMEGPYQNVRIGSGEFRTEGNVNIVHNGSVGGHLNTTKWLTIANGLTTEAAFEPEFNLYIGSLHATGSEGSIGTTKNIVAYVSDKRLKDDLKNIENPIEKIKQIGGYNFTWGTGSVRPGEKDVGVISQEVEEIMPEVIRNFTHRRGDVERGATPGTFKSVLYDRMVPLLVEGIKEQQDQIDYLKDQINTLVCGSIEPQ
jgi:hypothetical protein